MKKNNLHEKIWYYENIFQNTEAFIELLEKNENSQKEEKYITKWIKWSVAEAEDGYMFGYQKRVDDKELLSSNQELAKIIKQAKKTLVLAANDYLSYFQLPIVDPSSMAISKYIPGKAMGSHVDDPQSENTLPLITAILYLNDNYDGGDLVFKNQNIKIKPIAGSIVIFPSVDPFFHESLTLKSGNKYIMPLFWVKDYD